MKKVYENLVIEVIIFEKKDVITASSVTDNDNAYTAVYSLRSFNDFFLS